MKATGRGYPGSVPSPVPAQTVRRNNSIGRIEVAETSIFMVASDCQGEPQPIWWPAVDFHVQEVRPSIALPQPQATAIEIVTLTCCTPFFHPGEADANFPSTAPADYGPPDSRAHDVGYLQRDCG